MRLPSVFRQQTFKPELASAFGPVGAARALVHVHCHQKALVGAVPTITALGFIPDLGVELVQSACCGMAGSFGFEAEHYDVSRSMAMRNLIPAVDSADVDTSRLEHEAEKALHAAIEGCRETVRAAIDDVKSR